MSLATIRDASAVEKEYCEALGSEEFSRRLKLAEGLSREYKEYVARLPEDPPPAENEASYHDNEGHWQEHMFFTHRFRQLLMALNDENLFKFLLMSFPAKEGLVAKLLRKGSMI
jgi:site-specific DNA-cytosine methylase